MFNLSPELNTSLSYDHIVNFKVKVFFLDGVPKGFYESLSFQDAKDELGNVVS